MASLTAITCCGVNAAENVQGYLLHTALGGGWLLNILTQGAHIK